MFLGWLLAGISKVAHWDVKAKGQDWTHTTPWWCHSEFVKPNLVSGTIRWWGGVAYKLMRLDGVFKADILDICGWLFDMHAQDLCDASKGLALHPPNTKEWLLRTCGSMSNDDRVYTWLHHMQHTIALQDAQAPISTGQQTRATCADTSTHGQWLYRLSKTHWSGHVGKQGTQMQTPPLMDNDYNSHLARNLQNHFWTFLSIFWAPKKL